jgi:protein SCO1/2
VLENTPATSSGGGAVGASFQGVRVEPPYPKPDAILTADDGQPFDVRAETDGYITLFYVGYTHCPDICPTHMAVLAAALEELPAETRGQIRVLFATADPARDTPEVLDEYLAQFDPAFVGLTGGQEEMDAVQRSIGIRPAAPDPVDEGGNYTVSHAAFIIAYAAEDGLGHLIYPTAVTVDMWVNDLTRLARERYAP